MKSELINDAKLIASRDPAAKNVLEVILLYPGFHVLIYHKFAHWFYKKRRFFIARLISQIGRFFTGIEIHPGATIGKGLFIDHGMGIVIGESAVIGDNCTIYHGVTLGGTGKEKGKKRHPTIGNNVLIGAGAKVLGPCTIGDNSLIGANTFVSFDVEPYSTVVGTKGRVVKKRNQKVDSPSEELDQIHLPDPIAQELCRLTSRLEELERQVIGKSNGPCKIKKYSDLYANESNDENNGENDED
ncbi:serine O-acetyltransferase [Ruminiclostridium herbifermentans]|uniref:Serine acetyltransferase n=1 Tax=Ruminiclostridium herbifermentans TaxID=2488810 RepID=A0A4U7JJ30_9FIRM|nr:serine O-acetyltransferase EpsC [Ruminiclostridium herbifermentans]QNU67226.1 serine O-acetyltransferase [Ruminiclostridium herbifermentans]